MRSDGLWERSCLAQRASGAGALVLGGCLAAWVAACPLDPGAAQRAGGWGLDEPTEGLAIGFATPRGVAAVPRMIAIGFSRPMVSPEAPREGAELVRFDPPFHVAYRWLGTRTLLALPREPLPLSTRYTATIPGGMAALDGSVLLQDYSWSWETPRVRVEYSSPAPRSPDRSDFDDVELGPSEEVRLWFSTAVAADALAEACRFAVLDVERPGRTIAAKASPCRRPEEAGERERRSRSAEDLAAEDSRCLAVMPLEPLPRDAKVRLAISEDLLPLNGSLPLGRPWSVSYRIRDEFRVTMDWSHYLGRRCLVLEFSQPVTDSELREHLRLDPGGVPDPDAVYDRSVGSLRHAFYREYVPSERIVVRLDAGLTSIHGEPLNGMVERELVVPPAPDPPAAPMTPRVTVPWLQVVPSHWPHTAAVELENADSVEVEMWRASPDDALTWLLHPDGLRDPPTAFGGDDAARGGRVGRAHRVEGSARRGEAVVDLEAVLGRRSRGWVAMAPEVARWSPGLAIVTDLDLTAKGWDDGLVVWVTSLRTGRPVQGARVSAYAPPNRSPAVATTDPDGVVRLSRTDLPTGAGPGDRTWLVVAEHGEDRNALVLERPYPGEWRSVGDGVSNRGGVSATRRLVLLDRRLYAAGDVVRGVILFRERGPAGWEALGDVPVELQVRQPGREAEWRAPDEPVRTDAAGAASFEFALPLDAPTGNYGIRYTAAGGTVDLGCSDSDRGACGSEAAFVVTRYAPVSGRAREQGPPSLSVQWENDGDVAAGPAAARLLALHPMGAPFAGAEVDWSLRFEPAPAVALAGELRRFRFGASAAEAAREEPGQRLEVEGTVRLDAAGIARLDLASPAARGPHRVELTTELRWPRGDLAATAMAPTLEWSPTRMLAGIRLPNWVRAGAGRKIPAELLAIDFLRRAPVAGVRLRGTWTRSPLDGEPEPGSGSGPQAIGSCEVTTALEPVQCEVEAGAPGRYGLTVEPADEREDVAAASAWAWVVGRGASGEVAPHEPGTSLVPEWEAYAPGDTARFWVPGIRGNTSALVTVEREAVLRADVVSISAADPVLEVPIEAAYRAGVFVSAALRSPLSPPAPESSASARVGELSEISGTVEVPVEVAGRRLSVLIRAPGSSLEAGAEAELALEVRDATGAPVRAEFVVQGLPDEIADATGYELPDPEEAFERRGDLGVAEAATRYGIARVAYGGGGHGRDRCAPDFEPARGTAYRFQTEGLWMPGRATDDGGHAVLGFRVPDVPGAWRVTALAYDEADRFGVGEVVLDVRERLPIVVRVPAFVRVGDRFETVVEVGPTASAVCQLAVEIGTAGLDLSGTASRTVEVDATGARHVRFELLAREPGTARLDLSTVGCGSDWRSVESVEVLGTPVDVHGVEPSDGRLELEQRFERPDWAALQGVEVLPSPGVEVRSVEVGELVAARLYVSAFEPLSDVAIDVPVPAGFEVLDFDLGAALTEAVQAAYAAFLPSFVRTRAFEPTGLFGQNPVNADPAWFEADSWRVTPQSIRLRSARLPAGVTEYVWLLRAAAPGTFGVPAPTVRWLGGPEGAFGPGAGVLTVTDPGDLGSTGAGGFQIGMPTPSSELSAS